MNAQLVYMVQDNLLDNKVIRFVFVVVFFVGRVFPTLFSESASSTTSSGVFLTSSYLAAFFSVPLCVESLSEVLARMTSLVCHGELIFARFAASETR